MFKKSLLIMMLMAAFLPLALHAQEPIPYNEGFESMSSADDLTDAGWLMYKSHSGSFLEITTTASYVHTGSKALNIDSWNASSSSDWVIVALPAVDADINTLQISLWYQVSNGTVYVGYVTDEADLNGTFQSIASFTASSSYKSTNDVDLSSAPAAAKRIAIKYLNYYRCYIDDINVTTLPSCEKPVLSDVVNTTSSTATISWTPATGHNLFDIYWSTSNTAPTDATDPSAANQTGTSYTIPGLDPSTQYYAWVRGNCGTATSPDVSGGWTGPVSILTECEPEVLTDADWIENFDEYTSVSGFLPDCWKRINTTTYTSYQIYPYVASSGANSASNCLRFYSYYSSWSSYDPQPQYAVLPPMDNLAGKQVTLQAKGTNTTTTISTFYFGLMSNSSDPTTFEAIGSAQSVTDAYQEYVFTVPTTATAKNLAIMIEAADYNRPTNSVYIDDIVISNPPACPKPGSLNVVSDGQTATFTWESTASEWQVARATTATADPLENIIATVNANTFTDENLPLADYYYWVRSYCSDSEQSNWSGPVSVHIGYCEPINTKHDGKGITGVAFGMGDDIVNNTNTTSGLPTTSPYYGNYTSMIGAVQAGVETTIAITTSTSSYPYTFIIWVDFDNSLSFEDSEVVYTGKCTTGAMTLNANITVPATQAIGDYVMRISGADSYYNNFYNGGDLDWTKEHNPCNAGSSTYMVTHDYTLRVLEAPSCLTPTGLTVNYTGGSTATVSFTSDATAWNLDVNGTIQPIEENPYTLKDLELATTYVIKVQADCGNSQSDWTNAVSFTTDLCLAEDMCDLTFVLTDSYGDSWNGAYIEVVDVLTGITIAQMANENLNGTSSSGENEVNTKTLAVCDGREIQFVWHTGSYDSEASYAVYDINNEEIFSGSGAMSAPVDYTVNCAPITCAKPTDLEANAVGNTAIISWTSEASAWQLCLNDDEENLIDVDENPYTLKELELSTDYTVKVRANCGDEGYSNWTTNVSFTTGECTLEDACELSYELKVTEGYEQYGWFGSYLFVYDNKENLLASWTVEANQGTATGTLGVCDGKELVFSWHSGSDYDDLLIGSIKVYDVGGNLIIDSGTALTDDVEYTMNCNACPAVTGVTATADVNSAVVSWEGEHATFDLQYKQDITYHFEDGLGAWTTIDADGDGFNWLWSESGISGYQGSKCLYSQSYDNNGDQALDPDNYLVSPKVKLGGSISFYACSQDGDWLEHFGVAVSTTGNTSAADFTTIQDWTCASAKAQSPWTLYTADLSEYAGEEGYVAIRHYDSENKFYLDIDEITILEPGQTMPEWILVEDVTSPYTLEPLTEETTYAVQVRGYCQGETEPTPWSSLVNFTTVSGNVFIANGGNWNVDENWLGGSVPEAGSSVVIAANVIVPAGYVADAGKITVEGNATITVEDGGQLKTTYGGVAATMKKSIDAHSGVGEEMTGWNFIASPVISDLSPIAVTNLMTENEDDYDLYAFDETATDAEWVNYKQHSETFMIYNGQGYLYANAGDVDLEFTGELNPTNLTKKYTLEASGSGDFAGFFLMGNPFSCNAYLAGGEDFYVMNEDRNDIVPAISNTIAPLQGYFVKVDGSLNLNVTTTAPVNDGKGLIMSLSQNRGHVTDNAIIRFGEGNGLSKIQLNPKHTKLYIPQDNKDYAVVYSNTEGEMPVNFKAEKMGQYTISFNLEGTSFGYMHLYDKLTGNDVNLLTSPNYTFTGTPQDNEDRFILRFSSSASSDIFAYQSGSDVIVSGEGTLQVFDVLGRYVDSYEINGVQTIKSMPMGVYIFRMIGNEVKTQKIVVR